MEVKVLKGTLSKEKKDEMIKRVSETVAEIESSPNPKESLFHLNCETLSFDLPMRKFPGACQFATGMLK